jgi:broad specificity polyphosphatase/5'/3'-nucleotidase SurE
MAAGSLPGQGGNAGKSLITNGTVASWGIPTLTVADLPALATSNLTDYASDQAAKTATATKLAIAFAAAL